jgi:tellurite resistance-related uncharacterized protein
MMEAGSISAGDEPDLPTSLPPGLVAYRRTAEFTANTVPQALLQAHSTKQGTWGMLHVLAGKMTYRVDDPRRSWSEVVLGAGEIAIIEPTILHEVEVPGGTRFFVEFSR